MRTKDCNPALGGVILATQLSSTLGVSAIEVEALSTQLKQNYEVNNISLDESPNIYELIQTILMDNNGKYDIIYFADKTLEAYIAKAVDGIVDGFVDGKLQRNEIEQFTSFPAEKWSANSKISSLEGLENAINLTDLCLSGHEIVELKPLAELSELTHLLLPNNQISELSALENLKNLQTLSLVGNQVTDISILSNLFNLTNLYLTDNEIRDITPLASLPKLKHLHIENNFLNLNDTTTLGVINRIIDNGTTITYSSQKEDPNIVSINLSEDVSELLEDLSEEMTPSQISEIANIFTKYNLTISDIEQTQQVLRTLDNAEKTEVKTLLSNNLPYTNLEIPISVSSATELLGDIFTKKEIGAIVAMPNILQSIDIDINFLVKTITDSPPAEEPAIEIPSHWTNVSIKNSSSTGIDLGIGSKSFSPKQPMHISETFAGLDKILLENNFTESSHNRVTVEKYITQEFNLDRYYEVASVASKLSTNTLSILKSSIYEPITREKLAQVLYETTNASLPTTEFQKGVSSYNDVSNTSIYKTSLDYCIKTGLFKGTGELTLSPQGIVTAAELSSILSRLSDCLATI
ncbi:MAG: hypothetical protein ATN36_00545 [Epulopiscium sp. Nele67-Bin005]|nr:MAG: hypothetical protein ATN36_00545 [Epulopiscium sp. Nele67-Bin005]